MKKVVDKNHKPSSSHQQSQTQHTQLSKSSFSISNLLPTAKALDYKQYIGQLEDLIQTQQSSLQTLQSESKKYKQSHEDLQKENQQNRNTLQESIQIIEMLQRKLDEERETKRADEEILFHRIQQLESRCASFQQQQQIVPSSSAQSAYALSSSSSAHSLEQQTQINDNNNSDVDIVGDDNENDTIETRETISYTQPQPPISPSQPPVYNYNFQKLHANLRYVSEQIMEEIIRLEMSGEQCAAVVQAIEKEEKDIQETNKIIMKPDTSLIQADTNVNFNFGKASLRYPLIPVADSGSSKDNNHSGNDENNMSCCNTSEKSFIRDNNMNDETNNTTSDNNNIHSHNNHYNNDKVHDYDNNNNGTSTENEEVQELDTNTDYY